MTDDKTPRQIVAACALVSRGTDILMVKTGYRLGWEVPGGQVEIGESPFQAAIRETFEETGITTEITTLTGIYTNQTRGLIIFAFLGTYKSGTLTPSPETPQVDWVQRDKVLSLIEEPTMLDRVQDMLNYDGSVLHKAYTKNPYILSSYDKSS